MAEEGEERTLIERHPSMWRQHPIYFVLCCLLVPVLIGAIALLVWWLECRSKTITVTDERTIMREGLISRQTYEVRHRDVRSIQVNQGLLQRLLNTGSIAIGSAGHSGMEIRVSGIYDPEDVAEVIRRHQ